MSIHPFQALSIDGTPLSMEQFSGKVLLIVNVASECGLTPQYEKLEALHRKYEDQGFSVLGFPCNQFGSQEPGSDAEIKQFCSLNYGVSFPMFSKVDVNGDMAHPLFAYLRQSDAPTVNGTGPGAEMLVKHLEKSRPDLMEGDNIRWNFTKFLIDGEGKVLKRFEPAVEPDALADEIEALLA